MKVSYWWRRNLLFFLFATFAAPLDFHTSWYFSLRSGFPVERAVTDPLTEGMLFFYSVILAIEALMRIESHPKVAGSGVVLLLKSCLYIPFGIFAFEFLPRRYGGIQLDGFSLFLEWASAFLALVLASITHMYLSRVDRSS